MEGSSLAKLSLELRNRIYDFTLTSLDPFVLAASAQHEGVRQQAQTARKHPLALTSTCKVIRAECLKLFYASNAFEMYAPIERDVDGVALLKTIRRAIGVENGAALRSITVDAGRVCVVPAGGFTELFQRFVNLVRDLLQDSERYATAYCISLKTGFDYRLEYRRELVDIQFDLRNLARSWATAASILHDKAESVEIGLEASFLRLLELYMELWKADINMKSIESMNGTLHSQER